MSGVTTLIAELQAAAINLKALTPTDEELADAVGHVRAVEVRLADVRHRWEALTAEMDRLEEESEKRVDPKERAGAPVARGQEYELVPQYKTVRSYNTMALLSGTLEAMPDEANLSDAIRMLMTTGAVDLQWKWTQLTKTCRLMGVALKVTDREVSDDDGADGPMVGELRKTAGVKRVPLKGD